MADTIASDSSSPGRGAEGANSTHRPGSGGQDFIQLGDLTVDLAFAFHRFGDNWVKDLRTGRRPVKMGESVARPRSRVGMPNYKRKIPVKTNSKVRAHFQPWRPDMKIRIAHKIGAFYSVIVICLVTAVFMTVNRTMRTLLIEHEKTDLGDETKRKLEQIQNHISTMREDVLRLTGTPAVQGIVRAREEKAKTGEATVLVNGKTEQQWREELQEIFQELCINRYAGTGVSGPAQTAGEITGITQANPVVVTAPDHKLGDVGSRLRVRISDVLGMEVLNDVIYPVEVVSADEFKLLAEDGTGSPYEAYTGGGRWMRYDAREKPYLQVRFIGADGREIVRIEQKQFADSMSGKARFFSVPLAS